MAIRSLATMPQTTHASRRTTQHPSLQLAISNTSCSSRLLVIDICVLKRFIFHAVISGTQLKTLQHIIHSHSVIMPQRTLHIVQSSLTNVPIYVEYTRRVLRRTSRRSRSAQISTPPFTLRWSRRHARTPSCRPRRHPTTVAILRFRSCP